MTETQTSTSKLGAAVLFVRISATWWPIIGWSIQIYFSGEYTCTALNPYGEAICTVYISPEATKSVKKSKSGAKLNKSGSNKQIQLAQQQQSMMLQQQQQQQQQQQSIMQQSTMSSSSSFQQGKKSVQNKTS